MIHRIKPETLERKAKHNRTIVIYVRNYWFIRNLVKCKKVIADNDTTFCSTPTIRLSHML